MTRHAAQLTLTPNPYHYYTNTLLLIEMCSHFLPMTVMLSCVLTIDHNFKNMYRKKTQIIQNVATDLIKLQLNPPNGLL